MLMGIMMRFRTLSATNQSLVQMLSDTSDQVNYLRLSWRKMYCIGMSSGVMDPVLLVSLVSLQDDKGSKG